MTQVTYPGRRGTGGRIRVLVIAEACNPDWPSLPIVAYNTCCALREVADATVVTHVRNRPALQQSKLGQGRIVYVDNEYLAAPLYRLATMVRRGTAVAWQVQIAMDYPSYLAFEWEVWRKFGADLHAGRYDLVHRVTPMSPTIPSPLASWSPVPMVLGPLNGGLAWPAAFANERRREREWMVGVRWVYRRMPYAQSTYRNAAAVLGAFAHTLSDLPAAAAGKSIDFPEVGIDPERFRAPASRNGSTPLTFLFVGRLVAYKCPEIAVAAFAASPELQKHRLRIVGDGPERVRLASLIERHGLGHCVELVGSKTQAEVAEELRGADVFVFPSIRELGAGVVVEAMACGLACIVVDYGGPGGLISDGLGLKVPLAAPEVLTAAFREGMERLAADPPLIRALGGAAREHALAHYSWAAKARKFVAVYEWVLGRRRGKPDFLECGD